MNDLITFARRTFHSYRSRKIIRDLFPSAVLEDYIVIKGDIRNSLLLGKNVVIQSGCVLHLGDMEWCQHKGFIEIGDDSVISPNCVVYGCGLGGVRIGKRFDCAPCVGIYSSRTDYHLGPNHHIFSPVIIGDDVIIYANSVISPGVVIGNGATIAACSVVNSDVPSHSFVGGSLARIISRNNRR